MNSRRVLSARVKQLSTELVSAVIGEAKKEGLVPPEGVETRCLEIEAYLASPEFRDFLCRESKFWKSEQHKNGGTGE